MRRSCAPSMRKSEKRKSGEQLVPTTTTISSTKQSVEENSTENSSVATSAKRLKGNKLVFNIQWRDQSKKKHKTWKGNGIVEIQIDKNRAILLDHTGKYMGSTEKFKIFELQEGFQLRIGEKEVEFLDQIDNQNDYWAARKMLVENRGWGNEEWQPPPEQQTTKESKSKTTSLIMTPTIDLNAHTSRKKQGNFVQEIVPNVIEKSLDDKIENVGENVLQIAESLAGKLRPHQREGVAFLYDCLLGHKQHDCYGCILADDMGLGKTLQVLTVANILMRRQDTKRILIVSPRSLIGNWNNEIYKWLHIERMYGFTVDGSCTTSNKKLSAYAKQQHVPFVIVSYETLVSQLQDFQALNFDLLICDEGHRLKNSETKTYKALRELNIKRCILVTGTPVQNILSEFYVLADFVNPGIFGTRSEFRKHFEIPIELGQSSTANEAEKYLAAERANELKEISSIFMIRRMQNVNSSYLPKKREYICFTRPSKLQHALLRKALKLYDAKKGLSSQEITPLEMIASLRKICNHPYLLKHTKNDNYLTRCLSRHLVDMKHMNPLDSTKLLFVKNLLEKSVLQQRERIVLVSYHTKTLNILQELCDNLHLKYLRLDGATSNSERNSIVSKFNSLKCTNDQDDANVLLLSAKAGGVGLNLIGASRLVIYDIDWNPANDAQALSRIWRDGQQKDVHIYRLIMAGCIEEKIFQRQMAKTNLSDFLAPPTDMKSNSTSMKFSAEELQDLFYLQYDYNFCDTHQSLKCDCAGDGKNLFVVSEEVNQISKLNDTKQINDLHQWRHWQLDFDETFMKEACLWDAKDDLIYLFTNETIDSIKA